MKTFASGAGKVETSWLPDTFKEKSNGAEDEKLFRYYQPSDQQPMFDPLEESKSLMLDAEDDG